jgi:hypothetical protein
MGFSLIGRLGTNNPPFEYYLLTDAEGSVYNEALVQTSGRLTKCGATAVPEFISVSARTAEATSVTLLPVIRVQDTLEFATTSQATVASTLIGNKVTLHTDGATVTATTASGVFEISTTDGVTTNSNVRGFFRR